MAAEKPTPPFDTFVFDVDGTLLDTLDDLVVLTNDALAEFNLPPRTREEINSYVGNGVKALMYQAVPEGTPQDVADACLARWKENYGTYPNDLPLDAMARIIEINLREALGETDLPPLPAPVDYLLT